MRHSDLPLFFGCIPLQNESRKEKPLSNQSPYGPEVESKVAHEISIALRLQSALPEHIHKLQHQIFIDIWVR